MIRALGVLMLATGMATTALAADIEVVDAYARATPPGAPVGGAYFEIRNQGDEPDRLLRAASPVAETAELHTHSMEDGVARMREVEAIDVPASDVVRLQPGGYHIMLMELKQPLQAGEDFPLTLTFERAGKLELTVPVRSMTEVRGGHHHDHHHHEDHRHDRHHHRHEDDHHDRHHHRHQDHHHRHR